MAEVITRKNASPYYPPRSRWYGSFFSLGAGIRRRLFLRDVRFPTATSCARVVASFFVPGLGFYFGGFRFRGRLMMATYLGLALVSLAELGRFAGNAAFGLLIAIHAMSLNCLFEPSLSGLQLRNRILLSFAMLLALGGLLYVPARNVIESRWFVPVRINDRVVIIQKFRNTPRVNRGDWLAYSLAGGGDHNVYVAAGYGLRPVLGVAGDRIRFSKTSFEVNGVSHPRLENMPDSDEVLVLEKHWFIWPKLNISGHGAVPEATLVSTLLQLATVSEEQFEGKPLKWWFWHRQHAS
jgi:hypothetical protein